MARLAADHPSDVAAAGGILCQHDIAGPKAADRAIPGFDFDLTGKCNDVLPSGNRVIITQVIRRGRTKNNALRRL